MKINLKTHVLFIMYEIFSFSFVRYEYVLTSRVALRRRAESCGAVRARAACGGGCGSTRNAVRRTSDHHYGSQEPKSEQTRTSSHTV